VKVAAVQHDICWEDPTATHARLTPLIDRAVAQGAELVLLTEMFASGFSMAVDRIVEAPDGPSTTFLRAQAARHQVWIGGSIALRWPEADGWPRNVFTLAHPDGALTRYAKLHPFSYGGEHEVYASGDAVVGVELGGLRVTPFVCYDLRFANVFWKAAPRTDVYTVVANWPESRREHWTALLRARAIENQAYVVGVNRVGEGGGIRYVGDTRIVDPFGHEVATAWGDETVVVAELDPARVSAVRSRYPFLADRRDDVSGMSGAPPA